MIWGELAYQRCESSKRQYPILRGASLVPDSIGYPNTSLIPLWTVVWAQNGCILSSKERWSGIYCANCPIIETGHVSVL